MPSAVAMQGALGTPERATSTSKLASQGHSPDASFSHDGEAARSVTRTIAILAGAACKTHRLAIQSRITAAGFDVLEERMEQWSVPDDLDFLDAFLGNDEIHRDTWIERLSNNPIYVMVLERHRAAQRWIDMCGPDLGDPDDQLEVYDDDGMPVVPSGLRAQYGAASLYAPPQELAARQIAICFPDLATPEAAAALRAEDEAQQRASLAVVGSDGGFLVREDDDIVYDEHGKAFDAHSGEPLELQQEIVLSKDESFSEDQLGQGEKGNASKAAFSAHDRQKQRVFRARPLPASVRQPTSQPRLSRAAALRMGIQLPDPPKRAPSRASSVRTSDNGNVGISGLPKAEVAMPKSLAAPTLAPRMNKSAAARTKGAMADTIGPTTVRERKPVDFSNTPGHKRASLGPSQLASLAAPQVAPRLNKIASARVSKIGSHEDAKTGRSSTSAPLKNAPARSRQSSSNLGSVERRPVDFSNTPGHKRTSIAGGSTVKSLQAPSIAPRGNRASMSRGGFVGAEQASTRTSSDGSTQPPSRPPQPMSAKPRPSSSAPRVSVSDKENRGNGVGPTYQRERKPVDFSNTPGHKRASTGMAIASLAAPMLQPRSNAAAQRRLSVGGVADANGQLTVRPASAQGQTFGQNSVRQSNGSAARPSSRMSAEPQQFSAAQHSKRSSRPIAPPTSFRF